MVHLIKFCLCFLYLFDSGHCKSLAPKYEELAQKLAGESDLVIAKMDATANDVPAQFDVKG